jgi:alpha-N-arabinofuranosidase
LALVVGCVGVAMGLAGRSAAQGAEAAGTAEKAQPARVGEASLRVRAGQRSGHAIPAFLTGKFAEHLGQNILNGMDAQILRNPTFAEYPVWTGQTSPDGVAMFHFERDRIFEELRGRAGRLEWPEGERAALVQGYEDGLAGWWIRLGTRESVVVSPDAGPAGGRAQRVEVRAAGEGIAQWTYLPLHRIRKYQFEMVVRSPNITSLVVTLTPEGNERPATSAPIKGVSPSWQKLAGTLEVGAGAPAEKPYRLGLAAGGAGQFVVERLVLRPADHVGGADPDVVRMLRESRLPILRWPGGNFVSGYHWEDAVGPADRRPTRPNYAWGAAEPNLFGTDEFVAFCRAVGCEPMICINAGSGTPDEAARWVQYCNGSADTPMGARRAANGHRDAYRVRHWEIGNELWGRWQFHWTTASGYVDRYTRFAKAMQAADPTIRLYACGAPVFWGKAWNDTLLAGAGRSVQSITDHPLIGGSVPADAGPMDVYRDFMAVPDVLERKWSELAGDMAKAGVQKPRLAVTELQMFARLGGPAGAAAKAPAGGGDRVRLSRETLVTPATQAEALYDVLIYHAAIRLAPLVEMVTHSATVNHGGGLRKERERVYANPCHYAQSVFAAMAGATPVGVEVVAPTERAPLVLPDLKHVAKEASYRAIDAVAAVAPDGALLISVVHRGTAGPIRLTITLDDFHPAGHAEVRTLGADVPWAANSLAQPELVKPIDTQADVSGARLVLEMRPFSVARVRLPRAAGPSPLPRGEG